MQIATIILAAGKGKRLNSSIPKVMHTVGGIPLIGHITEVTQALNSNRNVVIVGENHKEIKKYLTSKSQNFEFIIQKQQLGTGHAVNCAAENFKSFDGKLLILYGDVPFIRKNTLNNLLAKIKTKNDLAVLGFTSNEPSDYGRLVINKDNNLEKIVEERDATPEEKKINLCNSGIICGWSSAIFSFTSEIENKNTASEFYLTDIIKISRQKNYRPIVVECIQEETKGINSRKDLAEAELNFQTVMRNNALENGVSMIDPSTVYFSYDTKIGKDTVIEPNVFFGLKVTIGNSSRIKAFSHLEGCTVSSGVQIGPFARVRPETKLYENTRVGNFVEIKNSTIGKFSKINHLSYVGDASIGQSTNIGAGTIFCNFNGVSKHHTNIGNNTFVGSNSSLIAPLEIGSGAMVGSGSVITKNVPDDSLAVERNKQKIKLGLGKKIMNKFRTILEN